MKPIKLLEIMKKDKELYSAYKSEPIVNSFFEFILFPGDRKKVRMEITLLNLIKALVKEKQDIKFEFLAHFDKNFEK